MRQIMIKENEAGQRLDKFLGKYLNQATKSFIYKMLRKKNIVLNGKKADGSEKLNIGDEVKLFLAEETIDKFSQSSQEEQHKKGNGFNIVADSAYKRPDILFENKHVCFMNKPEGILSQKADKDDVSMNEMFLQYLLESGQITGEELKTFKPSVCNRLDRNTTGLIIGGKTLYGLQKMSELLKDRSMHKYYLCIVEGNMKGKQRIDGYLVKNKTTNQVTIYQDDPAKKGIKKEDYSYIQTAYRALSSNGRYTLLEVLLITGRTHQIRAHLASIGHSIVGDGKYGRTQTNREFRNKYKLKNQLLHSWRLEIPTLEENQLEISEKTFVAPLPKQFRMIMEGEGLSYGNMEFQRT